MSNRLADIQLDSGFTTEDKSDMRDKLVADLRRQARQSNASRQARRTNRPFTGARTYGVPILNIDPIEPEHSIVEGEPQAVLIKNRNENLVKDVTKLRLRYAKLLHE